MDFLLELGKKKWIRRVLESLDLRFPVELEREDGPETEKPLGSRWAAVGRPGGWMAKEAAAALARAGAGFVVPAGEHFPSYLSDVAPGAALEKRREIMADQVDVLLFDATGFNDIAQLDEVFAFLGKWTPRLRECGRVILTRSDGEGDGSPSRCAVHGALGGIVRALSKELGIRGTTVHLVGAPSDARGWLEPLVRFLASRRSAFVTGQVWRLSPMKGRQWSGKTVRALEGRKALVTGAARGIGAAIARSLAGEGADVTAVDVPEQSGELSLLASEISGRPLVVDVTWPRAGAFMAEQVERDGGRLHILVHNAGVYFDRNLEDMVPEDWKRVYDVNLASVIRLTGALDRLMARDGRIVGIASISGLAGVGGQTCYSGSKAGLAEYLCSLGRERAPGSMTVNAVAAGFVHTNLTAGLPWYKREIGLRFSGMMQGGLPQDIGNLVAFLASPGAAALTGQTIRACGANFIGW